MSKFRLNEKDVFVNLFSLNYGIEIEIVRVSQFRDPFYNHEYEAIFKMGKHYHYKFYHTEKPHPYDFLLSLGEEYIRKNRSITYLFNKIFDRSIQQTLMRLATTEK